MTRQVLSGALAVALALGTGQAAAISVTPNTNATDLANSLLSPGVSLVGSPTFTGGDGDPVTSLGVVSAGTFTGGTASGLGFDNGVVLTSGDATLVDNTNSGDAQTGSFNGAGDADLNAIVAPSSTDDATVLEFDFTTTTGDLFFNYVFASEEYNEYVDSPFNDVFAFFVDGTNVAIAPDGNPVSINNVNCGNPFAGSGPNCSVFNNNDLQDGGPFFSFEYDGFTDSLVAQALGLGPGTHTIKLAIADTGDSALDSGVFLQAGSFQPDPGNGEPSQVPEPPMAMLFAVGLLALGATAARSRRQPA